MPNGQSNALAKIGIQGVLLPLGSWMSVGAQPMPSFSQVIDAKLSD